MGIEKLHSLGREQDVRALFEDSFGTIQRPTNSSTHFLNKGIQVNNAAIQKEAQVIVRKFTNPGSVDDNSVLAHKTKCEATLEADLVPSGTLGVVPDLMPLLFMGFGGMKFTYTFTVTNYATMNNDTFSFTFWDNQNNDYTETFIEGTDWNDGGSNDAAAQALATKIDSRGNLSATWTSGPSFTITTSDKIVSGLTANSLAGATLTPVSVEFIAANRQRALGSISLHQKMATLSRCLCGSWVEEVGFKVDGSSQPKLTFKLGGKDIIVTGVTGIASITDSDTLVVDKQTTLEPGSLVCFEDTDGDIDDNSGVGYLVSSVSGTTVNFSTAHNAADTDKILPFLPTPIYVGEALGNLDGYVQIEGDNFNVTNLDISIKRNLKPHDDNVFQETVSDVTPGRRETEVKFSIRCNEDEVEELTKYYGSQLLEYELIFVLGSTAGSIVTLELPRCIKRKANVTTPGDGDVMIEFEFTALATSTTVSDAITLRFS